MHFIALLCKSLPVLVHTYFWEHAVVTVLIHEIISLADKSSGSSTPLSVMQQTQGKVQYGYSVDGVEIELSLQTTFSKMGLEYQHSVSSKTG